MSSNPAKPRILVVDDDEMVRFVIRAVLEPEGYEIVEAESGEQGVEKFLGVQGPFPLVVMDSRMPGMGGPEALRLIHQQAPGTRMILLSGAADFQGIGRELEGARFFPKPFENHELIQLVRSELAAGTTPRDARPAASPPPS